MDKKNTKEKEKNGAPAGKPNGQISIKLPRARKTQKRVMNASPDDIPLMWRHGLTPQPKGASKLIKQLNSQQRLFSVSKSLEKSDN